MKTDNQTFPPVTMRKLPGGLFRLVADDIQGDSIIDLHPAHIQALAAMVDIPIPDRDRRSLERMAGRVASLRQRAQDLAQVAELDKHEAGEKGPGGMLAEFIAEGLRDLADDLAAILQPDNREEVPQGTNAPQAAPTIGSNGQLTIDG